MDIRLKRKVFAVDLFCGAGGLTSGLEKAGIDVRLGIDIDPACEYPYTMNNSADFLLRSIEEIEPRDIKKVFRKNGINLLAGCAPCQDFSTYNQKSVPNKKRWKLLLQFARLIGALSPEIITMENVPRLKDQDIFKEFLKLLEKAEYYVSFTIVNCEDYGIPQHRQRLVLLGSKLAPIYLLSPEKLGVGAVNVKDCIADLPPLRAGEMDKDDPLHQAAALSSVNMKRIEVSKPGGTWRDWKKTLVANCHRRGTGQSYPSVYGRMCWDKPAPTITTQFYGFGNGRFGHPEQNRAISLREGAILQSFPRDYEFVSDGQPVYKKSVGRMIGNAVPPKLGEVIGLSILEHVDQWSRSRRKSGIGVRVDA